MTKPISSLLASMLLTDSNIFVADCYTFTLYGGGVLRYCAGDQDLTVNGVLFPCGGVKIGPYFATPKNPAKAHWGLGTGTDTLTFDVIPGSATVGGQAFLVACQQGAFDGAILKLQRLFMPTYGDTRRGPITIFQGRVAEVDAGRSLATFMVNSFAELLDQQFPRNLYQPGCVNNLGDTGCGVNLAALGVAGTALTGSTAAIISANLATTPTGEFNQGKVTFTSGVLNGMSRTVKSGVAGAPGTISLLFPFPSAPANGDTFTIYPGCNKSFGDSNGCPKFSNTARWRGADRIPEAATAV